MHRIEFVVTGSLPPKKDGASSMWRKSSERSPLIELRKAALSASASNPLRSNIHLDVEIHYHPEALTRIGDLDNFITGICDGLMAAHSNTPPDAEWMDQELAEIRPSRTIGIIDDSNVVSIQARKIADAHGEPWYRVRLEGNW